MTQAQHIEVFDRDGERGLILAYYPRKKRYLIEYEDQTIFLPAKLLVDPGTGYYILPLSLVEALGKEDTDIKSNPGHPGAARIARLGQTHGRIELEPAI